MDSLQNQLAHFYLKKTYGNYQTLMGFMGTIVNRALSSLHRGLLDLMSRVLTVSKIYLLFIEMTYSLLND